MVNKWESGGEQTAVDVRPGGPGHNWRILDPNGMLDPPSGGGRARTTLWGRGKRGIEPRGIIYTDNPHDWTANVSYPVNATNFLIDVLLKCPFDVRARQRCDNLEDMVSYATPGMLGYVEITNNDFSYSEAVANPDGVQGDVKKQLAITATMEVLYTPVAHDDITQTTQDADINRVLSIGAFRCAGKCGPGKTEEDEWIWVTDRDATPGYSGNSVARLGYSIDRMVTRNSVPIDPFQTADATDVVILGDRIVVFSPDKAPAYASWQDILSGQVSAPNLWATMTGFSGITAGNFPSAACAVGGTIFMVGNAGRIWKSVGGVSATLIDNGATTSQNLTTLDFQSDVLGFIGGANGTLLRYYNGAITVLPVADANGNALSGTINRVRVPYQRENCVSIGTSGGEVWYTENATDSPPKYQNLDIPLKGQGSITDLCYAGYKGDQLWIIQTSADGTSRILRDHSGGVCGNDVKAIGTFNSPGNFKFNSIAMANVNMGIVVGQIHETYGYIGMIRPNII